MKKLFLINILFISAVCTQSVLAQSGLGFYHMAREIPQGTNVSPIFFPDAKVYLGLAGIQLNAASPYDAKEILQENANGEVRVLINIAGLGA